MMLSLKLLRSEWRAGDIRVLFFSLFLSVVVVTGLTAFIDRLQIMLVGESSQFLAADRVLSSPSPLDESFIQEAQQSSLEVSRFLSFQSMLYAEDEPLLVSVKAAQSNYPLIGKLQYRDTFSGVVQETSEGPAAGYVWIESRAMQSLAINIGDTVYLGDAELIVGRILVSEPDRGAGSLSLGPRLLMHWDDIEKTGVVQLGSRLSYHYLFKGEQSSIEQFEQAILEKLEPSHKWMDLDNTQPTVAIALNRARLFFLLASSVVVILASIAVILVSHRFSKRQIRSVAVMKTLGAQSHVVRNLYVQLISLITLAAYVTGSVFAYLLQQAFIREAASRLEIEAPGLSIEPFIIGAIVIIFNVILFCLPPIIALKNTSAMAIFRLSQYQFTQKTGLRLFLGFIGLTLILSAYTLKPVLVLLLMLSLVIVLFLVSIPAFLLIKFIKIPKLDLSHWLVMSLSNLRRNAMATSVNIAVFSIGMMLSLVLLGVSTALFDEWNDQLPEKTPNFFLVNVLESELYGLKKWLDEESIQSESLYPMTRGRLIEINGQGVRTLVSKEDFSRSGADRELNLSWSEALPDDNQIVEGQWYPSSDVAGGVSVESRLAERLKINIGDQLTFQVAAERFTVAVSSIREVDWDRMKPNFYMLMPKAVLQSYPRTWMTSFWLPDESHYKVNNLLQAFPTFIVIEVDTLIKQIRSIIENVALALQLVMGFVLLGSIAVLFSTILNGLAEREQANAVIRALGGSKKLLLGSLFSEFALMGLLAGLMATLVAEGVLLMLQVYVLHIPHQFHPQLWWIMPLGGALLIGLSGYLCARHIAVVPPMKLLRQVD